MYAWCQLTQWDVPDCDGPGWGVGLWTFTRMCSITQTEAIALFTSTLQLCVRRRASWAASLSLYLR